MKVAMGMGAFFCTLFGIFPNLLYNYLPYSTDYQPYTIYHLVEMMQILVFTFVGFWLLRKKLEGTPHIAIDTDWFYRRPADAVRYAFVQLPDRFFGLVEQGSEKLAKSLSRRAKNPLQFFPINFDSDGKAIKSDDFTASIGAALAFILLGFIIAILTLFL